MRQFLPHREGGLENRPPSCIAALPKISPAAFLENGFYDSEAFLAFRLAEMSHAEPNTDRAAPA